MGEANRFVMERADNELRRALDLVYENDHLALLSPPERRLALRPLLTEAGSTELIPEVADLIDAFGPLTRFMEDPTVTDVLVNGHAEVWIERNGELELSDVAFADDELLTGLVRRLVADAGGRVDPSRPICDVRLS